MPTPVIESSHALSESARERLTTALRGWDQTTPIVLDDGLRLRMVADDGTVTPHDAVISPPAAAMPRWRSILPGIVGGLIGGGIVALLAQMLGG